MPTCGAFAATFGLNHTFIFGARNVTLQLIASNLGTLPSVAGFGRPVVDQTGLPGTYDFSLNWLPDRSGNPSDAIEPLDAQDHLLKKPSKISSALNSSPRAPLYKLS
jgi:uncharacterized protein (TIGR03435 family)